MDLGTQYDQEIENLLIEIESSLLLGLAKLSLLNSGVLAESILLRVLLAEDSNLDLTSSQKALGPLIGMIHKSALLSSPWLKKLNWLKERRNDAAHKTGREVTLDDAGKAMDTVVNLLRELKLVNETKISNIHSKAAECIVGPCVQDHLKLDRFPQRALLDDLLNPAPNILVISTHGEVEQGHEHFSSYTFWKLHNTLKGNWRELSVEWPSADLNESLRLVELIDNLVHVMDCDADYPETDPLSDDGWAEWQHCLASIWKVLTDHRERLLIRHIIHGPHQNDGTLIINYLERVWKPLVERSNFPKFVLTFEVIRAPKAGVPLVSGGWRISRRESGATQKITSIIDNMILGSEAQCAALEELNSVKQQDLSEWLRTQRKRPKDSAESEAREIILATRGGRYDLVVQRIFRKK
ncbi:hypothetical protein ACFL27_17070 [candidate division CSSED10-310 bacterium]|uniref:DUF4145 domain-containing protein n=1 Tax=candidate division CSSED10-310 bacterium TaxID=2855610 RepID=A0ABV6Z0D5_UNCC1